MSTKVVGQESVEYTEKIDNKITDGLSGVSNSLAYRVHEIEKHFHNNERWLGLAAVPAGETHRADIDSITAFQMDAGNDTWGTWLQVIGSSDTPVIAGMAKFDLHRILMSDVENKKRITRIQIAVGSSGAAGLAAGDYTEIIATPDNDAKQDPYSIMMPRYSAGEKVWIRCWVKATNTSKIDFFIGLHEYPG